MNSLAAYLLLILAATLEAGGDALVRAGLHGSGTANRAVLLAGGAIVLFSYGLAINAPSWDFGRLLGVYVSLFFVVAQVINYAVFRVSPSLPIVVGGGLIVSGGLLITLWPSAS